MSLHFFTHRGVSKKHPFFTLLNYITNYYTYYILSLPTTLFLKLTKHTNQLYKIKPFKQKSKRLYRGYALKNASFVGFKKGVFGVPCPFQALHFLMGFSKPFSVGFFLTPFISSPARVKRKIMNLGKKD